MIREAEEFADEDKKVKERVDAKPLILESRLFFVRSKLASFIDIELMALLPVKIPGPSFVLWDWRPS